jgi:hypothetical protein
MGHAEDDLRVLRDLQVQTVAERFAVRAQQCTLSLERALALEVPPDDS